MRLANQRRGRYAVVALLLPLLCACDQVKRLWPSHDDQQYELRQDKQGRIVRVNKATGEAAIINGGKVFPIAPAVGKAASGTAKRPASDKALPTPMDATIEPATNVVVAAATAAGAIGTEGTLVTPRAPSVNSRLTITIQSPLLPRANASGTPLLVMAKGTVVTLLEIRGEWYHVQTDSRSGQQLGFVNKSNVSVGYGQITPVDISSRDTKPRKTESADPSRHDAKPEPMDLSITVPQ